MEVRHRIRLADLSELNREAGGHAVKGFAVDAEDFGGAFAIVAGCVEDVQDVASLDLVEIRQARKKFAEIVCREWWRFR